MSRSTLLWFLVAGCLGVALFLVKYEVQEREERLAALHREILADQEAVHVLEAEWSYLNRPGRLEALVRRHLDLVPMDTTRLGQIEHLPMRLPVLPESREDLVAETADLPAGEAFAPPIPRARPLLISAGVRQ